MPVVEISALQDKGKTLAAIALVCELLANHGYQANEVVSNLHFTMEGPQYLNNTDIKKYMAWMVKKSVRHKIILLDEIDSVFPARNYADEDQIKSILGIWQDYKLMSWIFYTSHLGHVVDKIVRDAASFVVIPDYDKETDIITLEVANGLDMETHTDFIYQASRFFPLYHRWELIT